MYRKASVLTSGVALLKHELHPFVNSGEIHEGSYLLIDGYHLAQLPRQSGNDFVW